ncbi:TRAP transporter substrate-binding protein [Psychrobium sp. 1_MG-2023]|uniref:TRAP transporter substrate-binding protein n=1 Tax=Psychrobium sp. 1_MG-2023 TaxID=3062624 RepID=UPI000C32ACE8|nr:TRAP transporter substrate-binding protein [Psychrobium sp. 1_MG-2023]MDP2562630.1 TRAP transporter substrate-binding protein [Psychrobium sp. 1_MG-2023]PKF54386.1 ABC transporter substrate-binding protein [Alteromonadales bacterium alter-6D02]
MKKINLALITLIGGLLISQSALAAKKVYRWKLAETWPTNFPVFGDATKNMAKMVKEMSDGRLIIQIHSKNKHKAPLGVFDMVKAGQYQMGHSAAYYWKGKDINTMFFTTMPFGMIAPESYAWFYYGGGMELMDKVFARHNMLSFPGGNTGNQMGGWFKKEINSLEDLKGLKMRIPGFAGEVLAELGAKPTNIPAGELYTALERNTIDALEWVGPSLDLRMGFHKIAPYYYTGWHEPAAELQFMVNKREFNRLPKDLQQILKVAMKTAAYDMYSQSTHESGKNLATIKADYPNIKIKTFPADVMNSLRAANDKLITKFEKKDPLTQEIIESQRKYLKQVRAWTEISDQAYLNSAK